MKESVMKKLFSCIFVMIIAAQCFAQVPQKAPQLWKAYKEKNYFKLDKLMSTSTARPDNPDWMLYKATVDYVFNKPVESNRSIDVLLRNPGNFNDTILKDLYYMRASNAYRLKDYKQAYIDDSIMVTRYGRACDSTELDARQDDITIFRNLVDIPRMDMSIPANAQASFKRDIAGLLNVKVELQQDTLDFVFDTGAGFSVIVESLAKKYGVRYIGGPAQTGTSTGIKVVGRTGLLDFRLGNIEVRNAAVLVLADSLLTYAGGAYVIRGVIGFPEIYAMKECIITDDRVLTVPQKPEETSDRNLALDGQYLIIRTTAKNDTLPMLFDSGNTTTVLSSLFFRQYQDEIVKNCRKFKVETGGAGGMVMTEAYILGSLDLAAGNVQCRLDSVRIYMGDLLGADMKYLYGNFGQDYVKRFSEMKINFASMHISFSGEKKK